MHMTIFVSRITNMYKVQYQASTFFTTLVTQSYARVHVLLTCRKHLHGHINSLRGQVCSHQSSLTHHL